MRGVCVTTALVFVVVCIGHADGGDSCRCCIKRMTLDSCAGQWNIAVCVRHTCFAAIDAFVVIIVVAGWVLSWYSGWPHNALVTFVGKATLWLWGWLPRPSSLHLRGSSREHFGASRWRCSLHPSRLVMAIIAFIAIGDVVVACCHLLPLHIAPRLTMHLQLCFLLVH